MKTILDLFNENKKEIYGGADAPRPFPQQELLDKYEKNKEQVYNGVAGQLFIDSRGMVNAPRAAALLASSPNSVLDLIGGVAAGLVGGNARRPTDTIFKNDKPFTKPVSFGKTEAGIKFAADDTDNEGHFYVKYHPQPDAGRIGDIKNTISNTGNMLNSAIKIFNKNGSTRGLRNAFQKDSEKSTLYGPKYSFETAAMKKRRPVTQKYSEWYKDDNGKLQPRNELRASPVIPFGAETNQDGLTYLNQGSKYDLISGQILRNFGGNTVDEFLKKNSEYKTKSPYVLFTLYNNSNYKILLPATISGLSEDSSPSIDTYKFIGSPFNLYKYNGVERTLKFDLQLYSVDGISAIALKGNLDKLRKLTFPDEKISAVNVGSSYSQLLFNPNIVKLTIAGLYYELVGIIESLSITVPDNTPWVYLESHNNHGEHKNGQSPKLPTPVLYEVSISMKIIEHPGIIKSNNQFMFNYDASEDDGNSYENYFTGYNNWAERTGEVKNNQEPNNSNPTSPTTKPSSGYIKKGGNTEVLDWKRAWEESQAEMENEELIEKGSNILSKISIQ